MIETSYIWSEDNSALLSWLQQNAVPEYFDSVTADETTASTIHCKVGEQGFLTITGTPASKVSFTVTNAAGKSAVCTHTYTFYGPYYGHKCACGLAITCANNTGTTSYMPLFITKDSEGNTTAVLAVSYADKTSVRVVSCVDTQGEIMPFVCPNQLTAQATTIVPFACGNAMGETRYTPNAFYMPTAQYTTTGKLIIDGVAYLSNGLWLLKDQ